MAKYFKDKEADKLCLDYLSPFSSKISSGKRKFRYRVVTCKIITYLRIETQ